MFYFRYFFSKSSFFFSVIIKLSITLYIIIVCTIPILSSSRISETVWRVWLLVCLASASPLPCVKRGVVRGHLSSHSSRLFSKYTLQDTLDSRWRASSNNVRCRSFIWRELAIRYVRCHCQHFYRLLTLHNYKELLHSTCNMIQDDSLSTLVLLLRIMLIDCYNRTS